MVLGKSKEIDILRYLKASGAEINHVVCMLDEVPVPDGRSTLLLRQEGEHLGHRLRIMPKHSFSSENLKKTIKQLVDGLAFLHHDALVAHLDIKPENIAARLDSGNHAIIDLRLRAG